MAGEMVLFLMGLGGHQVGMRGGVVQLRGLLMMLVAGGVVFVGRHWLQTLDLS